MSAEPVCHTALLYLSCNHGLSTLIAPNTDQLRWRLVWFDIVQTTTDRQDFIADAVDSRRWSRVGGLLLLSVTCFIHNRQLSFAPKVNGKVKDTVS